MSLEQPEQPAQEQANPYLPAGPTPLICDQWMGMDTSGGRTGVKDEQCHWLDGFIRVGQRRLRTLWGAGLAIYTVPGGKTITFFDFCNIAATPYCIVFLSDGSVVAVNTTTLAVTTVLTAGTILSPAIVNQGISQWGQQYLIIVANQTNGYWVWNGTTVFGAGSLAPVVTITNAGAAYQTSPTVVVSGGHGTGAMFVVTILNGQVTSISVANPGTGYLATDTPTITLSGGTKVGSGASLTAVLSHNTGGSLATLSISVSFITLGGNTYAYVSNVTVTNGGSGYSQFATATVAGGAPVYLQAAIALTISGGVITAAQTVPNQGPGGQYPNLYYAPPGSASVSDSGGYYVSSVSVVSGGTNYSPSTTITASGGTSPVAQATLAPVIGGGGAITGVTILNGGLYGNGAPTLTVTDTAVTATATIALMPFAIQGSAVETYQGHVWVVNGPTYYWSAPGSVYDFATSDGGGNNTSADSYLRVNYSRFIQTNGYLWLVADSSVNYISGVQTTGTPPSTTFTNQNADPQTGSPYPASVECLGRDVLFANAFGVHVIRGGNVEKISTELDGVWNTVANFGGLQLSSAQAIIYGKKVWVVLSQIVDPVSAATVNKLFLYHDKRWVASVQDVSLTYIKHQEIDSQITTYGTDGATIKPLFSNPSSGFQKVAQTKLWDTPGGYLLKKAAGRFWGLAKYDSIVSPNLTVSVDQQVPANSHTYTITGPAATGYFVIPPQAVGQVGELTGMTVTTSAADASLVSIMMDDKIVGFRG